MTRNLFFKICALLCCAAFRYSAQRTRCGVCIEKRVRRVPRAIAKSDIYVCALWRLWSLFISQLAGSILIRLIVFGELDLLRVGGPIIVCGCAHLVLFLIPEFAIR